MNDIYLGQIKTIPIIILPVIQDSKFEILEGGKLVEFIKDFEQEKGFYKMIKEIYEDKTIFDNSYMQRIGKLPDKKDKDFNDYTKWFKYSKSNFENIVHIIKLLNTKIQKIILSPLINKDNYDSPDLERIIKRDIFNDINNYELINRVPKSHMDMIVPGFKQKRLLVEYILDGELRLHHVTLKYDNRSKIFFNTEHDYLLTDKTRRTQLMVCPNKKSIDKLEEIRSLISQINISDSIFNSIKDKLPMDLTSLESKISLILNNPSVFISEIDNINKLIQQTFTKIIGILSSKNQDHELYKILNFHLTNNYFNFSDKKFIKFIIFTNPRFEGDLIDYAHITADKGTHDAVQMREASNIVYTQSSSIISLKNKNDRQSTEPYTDYVYGKGEEIECKIHNIYYI